jgi:glycosyltransferase involved in cell wall biosynthesis
MWLGDVSADRMGYGAARNHACEQLIEQATEADGIMWIDSDIRPDPGSITQLLWTARRGGHDFITGVYHHRAGAFHPVIYDWVPKRIGQRAGFIICDGYPENTVAKMGGCGFGFVWTSAELIRAIKDSRHWKEKSGKWFPDRRDEKDGYGEDMSFCILAKKAGYQLMVHTGVQVGHTGDPEVITKQHFRKRLLEEAKKDGRDISKLVSQ